jgi:hypothetical protein
MTDGGDWMGGHYGGMMGGGNGGMMGASPAEPLPYEGGEYPEGCIRGDDGYPQECDLQTGGCSYSEDPDYIPGSGCC